MKKFGINEIEEDSESRLETVEVDIGKTLKESQTEI